MRFRLFCRHRDEAELGLPVKRRGRRRVLFVKLCVACGRLRVELPDSEAEAMRAAEIIGEQAPANPRKRDRRRRR